MDELQVDRLLRRLQTLQSTVEELLTLGRWNILLEKKLYQIEELVVALPDVDVHADLAREWRDKLAQWWCRYAVLYSVRSEEQQIRPQTASSNRNVTMTDASTQTIPSALRQDLFDLQLVRHAMRDHLMDLIGNIADDYANFANQWTDRLEEWCRQYDQSLKRNFDQLHINSTQLQPLVHTDNSPLPLRANSLTTTTPDVSMKETKNTDKLPINSKEVKELENADNNEHFDPTSTNNDDSLSTDEHFVNQWSKDAILWELGHAFDELDQIRTGGRDIEGIRRLISTVVKALEIVPINLKDEKLQSEVFGFAICKLSDEMRDSFCTQYDDNDKCLYSLFNFLRLEINDYLDNNRLILDNMDYCKQQQKPFETISDNGNCNDDSASSTSSKESCYFCRQFGHFMRHCPEVRKLFCYRCYLFGHTMRRCKKQLPFVAN